MIIKCAWCGKTTGEKEPFEDTSVTHGICDKCLTKHFPHEAEKILAILGDEKKRAGECKKEKPTGKELTDFALKLVAGMRGHGAGLIEIRQYKDWTKEELDGVANLMLEDLREGRIEELEKAYLETCGQPFVEEEYLGG